MPDHLVFGLYYGECVGDCATLLKLEDGKLYADNIEYPFEIVSDENGFFSHEIENISFKKQALPEEYYPVAKRLLSKFPGELLLVDEQVFGTPDAYDQGGLYLAMQINGKRKAWKIDPADNFQEPEYAVLYKNELFKVFNELSALSSN